MLLAVGPRKRSVDAALISASAVDEDCLCQVPEVSEIVSAVAPPVPATVNAASVTGVADAAVVNVAEPAGPAPALL